VIGHGADNGVDDAWAVALLIRSCASIKGDGDGGDLRKEQKVHALLLTVVVMVLANGMFALGYYRQGSLCATDNS